jgi:hypothetical protein
LAFAFALSFASWVLPLAARGEDRVDLRLNYFLEPARTQKLHVFTPQLDINVDAHPALSFRVGYDADVVTGATPRTYGSSIDAVTGATNFTDVRHAVHGGAEVRVGPVAVDANYTFGIENDYRSHAIDAAAKVDLFGKNTTIRLGYAHNFDSVCNADNRGAQPLDRRSLATSQGCFDDKTTGLHVEPLAIDAYAMSLAQVFSPYLVGDLGVTFQVLDGFQSNPYRRVRLFSGTVEAQESEPLLRQRVAVQARLKAAVPRAKGALTALGRFYWDTWGVKSGTAELDWEQYIAPQLLYRVRGRFYQQTRALFYRDAGEPLSYEAVGPVGQYFTGDRELSPFRDWLFGLKVSYLKAANEKGKVLRVFESLDLSLKVDLMAYEALTKLPPNFARSDGTIDAVLLQLGLALRW